MGIQLLNDQRGYPPLEVDEPNQTLKLFLRSDSEEPYLLHYEQPTPDELTLEGALPTVTIRFAGAADR